MMYDRNLATQATHCALAPAAALVCSAVKHIFYGRARYRHRISSNPDPDPVLEPSCPFTAARACAALFVVRRGVLVSTEFSPPAQSCKNLNTRHMRPMKIELYQRTGCRT
jgi:hypothetical protein